MMERDTFTSLSTDAFLFSFLTTEIKIKSKAKRKTLNGGRVVNVVADRQLFFPFKIKFYSTFFVDVTIYLRLRARWWGF